MSEEEGAEGFDFTSTADGLRRWRARLRGPTARKGVLAVADQALVSGANFATGFLMARFCTKEEFGGYVLAFSVMLFLNGLQAALITGPMMVLGAAREGDDFRRYVTALGAAQLATGAALTGIAFAAVGVMFLLPSAEGLRGAFLGMAAALFFVQTQEFVRRVLFTRLEPARAFVNDCVFRGMQLAAVAALFLLSRRGEGGWLSGRNVFLAVACSALTGSAVGLWQVREHLGRSHSCLGLVHLRRGHRTRQRLRSPSGSATRSQRSGSSRRRPAED